MPVAVRVRVPAKVNLHLSVGQLRRDGFHELVNVFHAVELFDEVVASQDRGLSLTITGEGASDLPTDRGNLAWRAAELLATTLGVRADVRLALRKAIPVAGGMAGGSADAAATLHACARLWGAQCDLGSLAAQLGSDVNFALLGGTAVGTGRGEQLRPVPAAAKLHWVFALAHGGISAAAAYRQLDQMRDAGTAPSPIGSPDALLAALGAGDVPAIASHLGNDLQPAALALRPELANCLEGGVRAGALAGIVSGSGPTCAFLCADPAAAKTVAEHVLAAGACRHVRVTTGPAGGMEIGS